MRTVARTPALCAGSRRSGTLPPAGEIKGERLAAVADDHRLVAPAALAVGAVVAGGARASALPAAHSQRAVPRGGEGAGPAAERTPSNTTHPTISSRGF